MNSITHSTRPDPSTLLDLLDPQLGVQQRTRTVDQLLADPRSAQELRLLLALDSAADTLACQLRPAAARSTRWLRLGAPVAAAALLLLGWPQHLRQGQQATLANLSSPVSDSLLSGSFEASREDQRFAGGFE